jgi:hypothetical protein
VRALQVRQRYSPENTNTRTKPRYQPNLAHDKSSPLFNRAKTPEPLHAQLVYETSAVRGGMGTWYALIGLRNSSATGGATIDVFLAAGKNYKVHIAP